MSNRGRPPHGGDERASPPGEASEGRVIHVQFGRGGGRVEPPAPSARPSPAEREGAREHGPGPSTSAAHGEPVTDVFSTTEVEKLLGLSASRLRALARAGVVTPSGQRRGRRAYTFADVIALRAAKGLLESHVRPRDVGRAIENIKSALPKVTRPLAELRIVSDGKSVVVRSTTGDFEPLTGQMLLSFEVKELRDAVVRELRPPIHPERARTAYEHYLRASELDESPATISEAEALYRKAIELDPYLAIAYTNLGNLRFRQNDEAEAEALYHRALGIDGKQPEAQYNLGYLLLERGRAEESVPFFHGAIDNDPSFADAYFNLAMAYEQTGARDKARPCWRRYLALEPSGTWADIARKHLV